MDINTAYVKQNNSVSRGGSGNPKAAEVDSLAAQQTPPSTDRDGDNDNSVARDSVSISSESLKLSSTSSVQGTTNQTQIPSSQDAQKVVDQLVTGIQNNPQQAQNAASNVSSGRASSLLAA